MIRMAQGKKPIPGEENADLDFDEYNQQLN
jgi:hypothetical protein